MNCNSYEKHCLKEWGHKNPQYKKGRVTPKKGKYNEDGGVDLILYDKDGELIYGQCKHYHKNYKGGLNRIPVKDIRALKGCMARDNVNKGIFFSPLRFSDHARKEAEKDNIKIKWTYKV